MRRFLTFAFAFAVGTLLSACGGGGTSSAPLYVPRQVGSGERQNAGAAPLSADSLTNDALAPEPLATDNGVWWVEYNESESADNNLGENTGGHCSGGLHGYGCDEKRISVHQSPMAQLTISAPAGEAPSTASVSGEVALGSLDAIITNSADAALPFTSGSYTYVYQLWEDRLLPPAPDATHPMGTPITYQITLVDETKPFTVDCYNESSYELEADAAGAGSLVISNGCTASGGKRKSAQFVTSYGAPGVTMYASLLANVYAADNAAHTTSSNSFPEIHGVVYVKGLNGATYTTASGKCYKDGGHCP